jgi:hypothetical protein
MWQVLMECPVNLEPFTGKVEVDYRGKIPAGKRASGRDEHSGHTERA